MKDRCKQGLAVLAAVTVSLFSGACAAQGMSADERMERARRMLAEPNPLPASDSLWIEELTYMEVRDKIASGMSVAIVPTGGIEENGPYLATGKHNVILEGLCPMIAADLGNALCAPIVQFVPEGSFDPPSGAMLFPGSFSVRDETYVALLEDIGASLKLHGFSDIVFIGDSGGNLRGMEAAAENLNVRWADDDVRAHHAIEFYTPGWEKTEVHTEEVLGVSEGESDGHHDDIWVTAMMMVTDPSSVRHAERVEAGMASINGIDISDVDKTVKLGKDMMEFRAGYTADAIRERIATR